MKWLLVISVHILICNCYGQDIPELNDELESLTENSTEELDDDSPLQELFHLHQHPLNINRASEEELSQLPLVSPLLIKNLMTYQAMLGKLVHINELQAVPGWTPELIRKLLPYITIDENDLNFKEFGKRFKNLQSSFLFRVAQNLGSDKQTGSAAYKGSAQHVLMKLQFNSGNSVQFGALAEKDAGEAWLVHGGFDFNSFYFFARNIGFIKKIAIGDYQVNMGQGLIQWQGMARKKSANVLFINQQEPLIIPYHSSGEVKFHRGLAVVVGKRDFEWMTFISTRSLTANLKMDSLGGLVASSISSSGYHRTQGEIEDRNKLHQFSAGSTLAYSTHRAHLAMNWIGFQFSHPIQKPDEAYNLFSFHGRRMINISLDYSYTTRNIYLFGEFATDKQLHKASINGMLLSLDRNLDCSIVVRTISRSYSSIYANAFTENSAVTNETGCYIAISFHPNGTMRVDAYADVFYFPWLKYKVDAPSEGREFLLQFSWQPNKRIQLYGRWKLENKEQDDAALVSPMHILGAFKKVNFRTQLNWDVNKRFSLSERLETSRYFSGTNSQDGFLLYNDFRYQALPRAIDCWGRIAFFQTDSYDARIYAFERDVQYGFSVPAYSGKGVHYALDIHYALGHFLKKRFRFNRSLDLWINWSQTIFSKTPVAQGGESGRKSQSLIRFQMIVS